MKKLIELDAALDALREVIVPAEDIGFGDELTDGYNDGIDMAVTVVSGLPTIDAVPVVRCRDCRHWSERKYNVHINGFLPWCRFSALQREANDYCSYGSRKDGDNG